MKKKAKYKILRISVTSLLMSGTWSLKKTILRRKVKRGFRFLYWTSTSHLSPLHQSTTWAIEKKLTVIQLSVEEMMLSLERQLPDMTTKSQNGVMKIKISLRNMIKLKFKNKLKFKKKLIDFHRLKILRTKRGIRLLISV